jgi:septal ring factor EnvC (AmiA/AmiB activator)
LQAAKQAASAHADAAALARRRAQAEALQAALLAEQQVLAAQRLRRLEEQTGDAADRLALLQAEASDAAAALRANEAALTALLPIMQRLSAAPAATIFAMPEAPADAVRGILILQDVAAEIESRSEAMRAQAASVASLLEEITAQQRALVEAAAAQRKAEDALTAQIDSARAAETADSDMAAAEAAAALAANRQVRNLRDVIAKLQAASQAPPILADVKAGAGAPVAGYVVQNYGDETLAGPAQGVTYKAAPGARVVAPCAGPVLFADRFHSYGLLVILSCGAGTDFVLSGMQRLDVSPGERVARGQPVGEMLGFDPKDPSAEPRLYVELRQNGAPVNPSAWLTGGGSG